MNTFLLFTITAAVWLGAANTVLQTWRAPEDWALRAAAMCVLFLAAQPALGIAHGAFDTVTPGLAKLLTNFAACTAMYWLLAFFVISARGADKARLRLQLVPLAVSCAVQAGAWLIAPAAIRIAPAAPTNAADPHAIVFVVGMLTYVCYAIAVSLRWAIRYAYTADAAYLRRGLWLISVGLGALLAASALRIGMVLGGAPAANALHAGSGLLLMAGLLLFVGGVSYPAAVGMARAWPVWRTHRRAYHEIEPLWTLLHEAFPDLALGRESAPGVRWLRRTHRSFYRRIVEIRDGLVQLTPYYDAEVADRAEQASADLPDAERASRVEAAVVVAALRARSAGAPPDVPRGSGLPGGHDLESDVAWLRQLATAISRANADGTLAARR